MAYTRILDSAQRHIHSMISGSAVRLFEERVALVDDDASSGADDQDGQCCEEVAGAAAQSDTRAVPGTALVLVPRSSRSAR